MHKNSLSCASRAKTICNIAFIFVIALFGGHVLADGRAQTLRQAAAGQFQIGAAITAAQVNDPHKAELIVRQFDCVTAEYEFMPQFLEPQPGKFTFDTADRIAEFARRNHLSLTGHMLCWNQLTPKWMFEDERGKPLPRAVALAHLKEYIDTVVKHFDGRVDSWNVVNEAISDAPGEELRDTPARRAIGDDYIEQAFKLAHAANASVALYYNDYNIEDPIKLPKTIRLIHRLKQAGVRLDSVGIQGHWLLDYPPAATIDSAIETLGKQGVKVCITELDVDVLPRRAVADLNATQAQGANPYADGIPETVLRSQAQRYTELFKVFHRRRSVIERVTFWGLEDGQSWLNDFPVKGRTNYPLLFDRKLNPKPARAAVIESLEAQ